MKLDHLGIAVKDIKGMIESMESLLGESFSEVVHVDAESVYVSFAEFGDVSIEFIQASSDQNPNFPILQHPILSHIEKHGPGLHHIAFQVDDIADEISKASAKGVRTVTKDVREGARGKAIFLNPSDCGGLLIEYCENC